MPKRTQHSRRWALRLALIAAAITALVLLGWLFAIRWLHSFGMVGVPLWPVSALGHFTLALGFVMLFTGRTRLAFAFWAYPTLAGLSTVVQLLLGIDPSWRPLLFDDQIAQYPHEHAGRLTLNSAIELLLLASAGFASQTRRWRAELVSIFTTLALALAATAALVSLVSNSKAAFDQLFVGSLPGCLSAMALAGAIGIWNVDPIWDRAADRRGELGVLRALIPLLLLVPLVPLLLEILLLHGTSLNRTLTELVVLVGNAMIVAVIAFFAVHRLSRDRRALVDLTQALEGTPVALAHPDGRITHWSRGCEELYGFSAQEMLGRQKHLVLRSRCERIGQGGLPRPVDAETCELIETARDGRELVVLERCRTVRRANNREALIYNLTDITAGAVAMAALNSSEERLALATSAHQLGIIEWDVLSGNFHWSPGTEQRLGVAPGALSTFESWRAHVDPEDVQHILDTIARAVADRAERYTYRYRFRPPGGSVRAIEGSSRAFYDADGNLVRTVGAILDITVREEREAALRGREAQLRSVLETVPDAMVVIDEAGTIREFSAAAETLWGYRAEQVIGRSFTLLTPADERQQYVDRLQTFLETGEAMFVGTTVGGTGETADGRRFPLEGRTGMAHVDGAMLFTIFFRDLTEQLQAEERLSDLSAELAHVSRQSAMSELAADLAHELNQPLSATSNFLAAARMLVERGGDDERVVELLRMGAEQTQRAGEIIRRLRNFMAKGEVEIRAEPLERTVREAVELVLVGTGQFDIRLSYALSPDARFIFADRIQVQQVLVNLLRNSVDALRAWPREQRSIEIGSAMLDDGMVEIRVSDSGPGLPEKVLTQLFSRFVTTKEASGMGIGLSISRRIIEAHGGTLSAENRPEGGATFRFTLPSVSQDEEERGKA